MQHELEILFSLLTSETHIVVIEKSFEFIIEREVKFLSYLHEFLFTYCVEEK